MEEVPGTPPDASSGPALSSRSVAVLVGLSCTALLAWTAVVRTLEASLLYVPSKYPHGDWEAPARSTLKVEDVFLTSGEGVRIHGWYVNCPVKTPRPGGAGGPAVILYLHGNAGSLAGRFDWMTALASSGADVFGIDYQGYGRSEGEPSEEGFYEDANAAYDYLVGQRRIPSDRVIIYGKSIGGGPACDLAARRPCGALVLQSTFTSFPDMASAFAPVLPSRWFLATSFDNLSKISLITVPKVFIHSRTDELIPYWMGEALHEEAAEPKRLISFSGFGHNDLVSRQRDALLRAFREVVGEIVAGPNSKPGS